METGWSSCECVCASVCVFARVCMCVRARARSVDWNGYASLPSASDNDHIWDLPDLDCNHVLIHAHARIYITTLYPAVRPGGGWLVVVGVEQGRPRGEAWQEGNQSDLGLGGGGGGAESLCSSVTHNMM